MIHVLHTQIKPTQIKSLCNKKATCKSHAPQFVTKLKADNGSLIIWLDYMKLGRLSTQDLNVTMDCVRKALASMPERGVCFAIAPHLVSDRRSGLRAEMRRLKLFIEKGAPSYTHNIPSSFERIRSYSFGLE